MTHPQRVDGGHGSFVGASRGAAEPARPLVLILGGAFAAVGTVTLLLGLFPRLQLISRGATLAAAFIPYGTGAWLLAALGFLASGRRRRVLALATLPALAVQGWWLAPYWPRPSSEAGPDEIALLTVNLRCDRIAVEDVAAAVETASPDVVVLVDVIPGVWRELRSGVLADLEVYRLTTRRTFQPQVAEEPGEACFTGVAARGPITLAATTATPNPQRVLRVALPEADLSLVAVDVENPVQGFENWRWDLAAVREAVALVEEGTALAVVGDFNAVREHAPMAELRRVGLMDAAEVAGAGWVRTFPAGWVLPPLLAVDHVMVRDLGVTRVGTFAVDGSYHLGVTAEVESR